MLLNYHNVLNIFDQNNILCAEQNEKLVKFDIKFRHQHKSSDFIFIIIIKQMFLHLNLITVF